MTETNEQTVLKTNTPKTEPNPETQPITTSPEKKLVTWEAAILLSLSFLAALWYWFGHNLLSGHYYGPGIGLTISHWMLTAAVLVLAKLRKTLKPTSTGIFLLILSLLLSAVYGIFANTYMKLLNLPVFLLLSTQALFTLTEHNIFPSLSGQGLWEGFRQYFISLFHCWPVPFRALSWKHNHQEEGKAKAEQIFFGILAALGTAVLAMAILSSADEMFAGVIGSVVEKIESIDGPFVAKLFLSFPLAMLLFSHWTSLLYSPLKVQPLQPKAKSPMLFRMVLTALTVIYGLFAYVQIRYPFIGTKSVQMSGGYAAYARNGFFQLVLITLLTLCLILPALALFKKDKPLRILCVLVAVLTIIIDISAFFRMRLYIEAYGLTTLRIVTLWGITMILFALLATIIKIFLPDTKICPVLAIVLFTTWIGLNYINIDLIMAENQVARFNVDVQSETWSSIINDREYWAKRKSALPSDQYWSPDYYPAFAKIENKKIRTDILQIQKTRAYPTPPLYDWSFSYLQIPKQ